MELDRDDLEEVVLEVFGQHDGSVSFIIVSRNRKALVRQCLASCLEQKGIGSVDLFVVINYSEDDSEEMIKNDFPGVRSVTLHKNFGFFPALNIAISNCRSEFVFTVDDDAHFISERSVREMLDVMRARPSTQIVTCGIEGPHERGSLPSDSFVSTFKTGFSLIRRSVFEGDSTFTIGYYPDIFYRSAGEAWLSSAIWDKGGEVVEVGKSLMFHEQTMAGRSEWDWRFYGTRSQVLLVFMRDPIAVIPLRLASKLVSGTFSVFRRGAGLRAFVAGWLSAMLLLGHAWSSRAGIRLSTFRRLHFLQTKPCPIERSNET